MYLKMMSSDYIWYNLILFVTYINLYLIPYAARLVPIFILFVVYRDSQDTMFFPLSFSFLSTRL